MNYQVIPFFVIGLAAIMVMGSRVGKDIHIPVFLLPWYALTPEIGVGVTPYQFLILLLTIKYFLKGRFSLDPIPSIGLIVLLMIIGVVSAAITLSTHTSEIIYVGGEFRNGWLRSLVVMVVFTISVLPFALLLSPRISVDGISLARTYSISVTVLCLLGIFQYIMFHLTGADIFPIGMFGSAEDQQRSAIFDIGLGSDIRPSSLAGEPKGLGMNATAAAVIWLAIGSLMFPKRWIRHAVLATLMITIYLTQSTSAMLGFGVALCFFFGLRLIGNPLSRRLILLGYLGSAFCILGIYLYYVSTVPLTAYRGEVTPITGYLDFVYRRTLGRIQVEDFDWVILKSFLEDPTAFLFGRGFGLGHLFVDPYIPDNMRYYMEGRIQSPKSGVVLLLTNGGLFAIVLFCFFLAACTPVVAGGRNANTGNYDFVRAAQTMIIPLVLLMFLRVYVYDVCMFMLAVVASLARTSGFGGPLFARRKPRSRLHVGGWTPSNV